MAEEKKVPISELETIDDVIQKHPQLIEKYNGSLEDIAFAVHGERQKEVNRPIDIFDFFADFYPTNSFTNLNKFKESYSGTNPLPQDNVKAINIMYQNLREKVGDNDKNLKDFLKGTSDSPFVPSILSVNLKDYADIVDPVTKNETLTRKSFHLDLDRYEKNIKKLQEKGVIEKYTYEDFAQIAGIDPNNAPVLESDVEFAKSFARNYEETTRIAGNSLKDYYSRVMGKEISFADLQYTYDTNLQQEIFVNPITGKTQFVDNPDSDSLFGSNAGTLIPIAFDLAGTIALGAPVAAVTRKIIAKATEKSGEIGRFFKEAVGGTTKIAAYSTGAGVGYGIGDLVADAYRTQFLNPNMKKEEFLEILTPIAQKNLVQPFVDTFTKGDTDSTVPYDKTSGIVTAVLDGLYRLTRGVGGILRGGKMTPGQYNYLTKNIDESNAIAKFLNENAAESLKKYKQGELKFDVPDLKFTTADASRRADFKNRQFVLHESAEFGDKMDAVVIDQYKNMNNIFKIEMQGAGKKNIDDTIRILDEGGELTETALGRKIQNIMESYRDPLIRKQLDEIYKGADEVDSIFSKNQIKNAADEVEIRGPLELILDNFDESAKKWYQRINKMAQVTKVGKIPMTNFIKTYKGLEKNSRSSIIKSAKSVDDIVNVDKLGDVSFARLKKAKTDLMRMNRLGEFTKFPDGTYEKLVKSLDDDIKTWAKGDKARTSVRNEWLNASNFYREGQANYGDLFRRLVKKDELGNYTMAGDNVFKSTFKGKGTTNYIKKILDVKNLFKNRDFKNAYLKDIQAFYRREVLTGRELKLPAGKQVDLTGVNPVKHKKFMEEYGENIRVLFPDEYNKLISVKDKLKVFDDSIDNYGRQVKDIERASGGKVTSLEPEHVFKNLWNKEDPQKFLNVAKIIQKTDKDLYGELQAHILKKIHKATTVRNNILEIDIFNPPKFTAYLKENDELVKMVFSPRQQKFLKKFSKALDIQVGDTGILLGGKDLSSAVDDLGPSVGSVAALRAMYFRPLSQRGVAFTGFLGRYSSHLQQKLADIILEPNMDIALDNMARLYKTGKTYEAEQLLKEILKVPLTYEAIKTKTKDALETTEEEYLEKRKEDLKEKLKSGQSKLSQRPIDVAQMNMNQAPANMPQAPTTDVASAPVNKPQGIAALSPGQGSGTNAQTIDRMAQVGLPLFNRG